MVSCCDELKKNTKHQTKDLHPSNRVFFYFSKTNQILQILNNSPQKLFPIPVIVRKVCPSDFSQREGRILRQGNMNEEVTIYKYVIKLTFDSFMCKLLKISNVLSHK